ncbi:hypothetical protein LY474_24880 [Myxococcus stipitatus]|uniref:hypothetical protein n=1 Tax=Myxococcus stipitatus TaxID=83455 RepID=UPI001F2C467F|nr:hypothetical protein [Myxococcus stipitatus]MCE9671050.1 hypothetical protein [Myxococcus stipitatus]
MIAPPTLRVVRGRLLQLVLLLLAAMALSMVPAALAGDAAEEAAAHEHGARPTGPGSRTADDCPRPAPAR